mmetsp:Transcript_23917/g.52964  ORF Transcript_23917/g.52964 Transcript_23917/m.52964 type:complete len:201 (+) Transcript_23917:119-721(+)
MITIIIRAVINLKQCPTQGCSEIMMMKKDAGALCLEGRTERVVGRNGSSEALEGAVHQTAARAARGLAGASGHQTEARAACGLAGPAGGLAGAALARSLEEQIVALEGAAHQRRPEAPVALPALPQLPDLPVALLILPDLPVALPGPPVPLAPLQEGTRPTGGMAGISEQAQLLTGTEKSPPSHSPGFLQAHAIYPAKAA